MIQSLSKPFEQQGEAEHQPKLAYPHLDLKADGTKIISEGKVWRFLCSITKARARVRTVIRLGQHDVFVVEESKDAVLPVASTLLAPIVWDGNRCRMEYYLYMAVKRVDT
jgi:hypothetical protein